MIVDSRGEAVRPRAGRRRDHLLQLPTRSRAADHPRLHPFGARRRRPAASQRALRVHDRVRQHDPHARGLSAGGCRESARRGGRRRWLAAAAHRRDREVRARHVLLQRRARDRVRARGARADPVAESGHLRPAAGHERRGDHRRAAVAAFRRRVALRPGGAQLCQRGHGRAHRRCCRPPSRRSRWWTRASGASSNACARWAASR